MMIFWVLHIVLDKFVYKERKVNVEIEEDNGQTDLKNIKTYNTVITYIGYNYSFYISPLYIIGEI